MGCRNYPRRRLAPSARDRDGVGHSASILEVPLSPHPAKGPISEPVTKPVPRSILRVLKVVSAARALNVRCNQWLRQGLDDWMMLF
jgi:hypothetical protein